MDFKNNKGTPTKRTSGENLYYDHNIPAKICRRISFPTKYREGTAPAGSLPANKNICLPETRKKSYGVSCGAFLTPAVK